jgi:hypothetical protein
MISEIAIIDILVARSQDIWLAEKVEENLWLICTYFLHALNGVSETL